MDIKPQIFSVLISIIFFIILIRLLRDSKINIRYSASWIALGIIILIVAIFPNIVDYVSSMIGIHYPPATLFLIAIIILLEIVLHHSILISKLEERNKELAQSVGIISSSIENENKREKINEA